MNIGCEILKELIKPLAICCAAISTGRGWHHNDPLLYIPSGVLLTIVVVAVMVVNYRDSIKFKKGI